MARWLFKNEPDCYSFADLERDGETTWDGVSNALALKHLRAVAVGDEVLFYHTGKEKAVVGVMAVIAVEPPTGDGDTCPRIGLKPVRRLENPVTLAAVKADPAFAGWELVRMSRLSVMPVSDVVWKWIETLSMSHAVGEAAAKKPGKAKRAAG